MGTYSMYFERANREHVTLEEWKEALNKIEEITIASKTIDDFDSWVGHKVNPLSKSKGQFHERDDRKFDAEIYFEKEKKWKRVFYWHTLENKNWGVITFEQNDDLKSPVNLIAEKIKNYLGARIVGEDDTWYEN